MSAMALSGVTSWRFTSRPSFNFVTALRREHAPSELEEVNAVAKTTEESHRGEKNGYLTEVNTTMVCVLQTIV